MRTSATKLEITYHWRAEGRRPDRVAMLDDGRVMAEYTHDGCTERVYFDSMNEFGTAYPTMGWRRAPAEDEVNAPPLHRTHSFTLDWAAIHHALAEIDRARRGTGLGRIGVGDVFGGTYRAFSVDPYDMPNPLARLVRLVEAVHIIARQAWDTVHGAERRVQQGEDRDRVIEEIRAACRVAIACSEAYSLFEAAGLIENASALICGTGQGYGLAGLRWLAGAAHNRAFSKEEIRQFAFGGPLPSKDRDLASVG